MFSNTPGEQSSDGATLTKIADPRLSHVHALADLNDSHLVLVRWFAGLIGERTAERIFGLADEQFGAAYDYVENSMANQDLSEGARNADVSDVALYCSRLRWAVNHVEKYFADSKFPPNPIGGTADHWRIALIKAATNEFGRGEG